MVLSVTSSTTGRLLTDADSAHTGLPRATARRGVHPPVIRQGSQTLRLRWLEDWVRPSRKPEAYPTRWQR